MYTDILSQLPSSTYHHYCVTRLWYDIKFSLILSNSWIHFSSIKSRSRIRPKTWENETVGENLCPFLIHSFRANFQAEGTVTAQLLIVVAVDLIKITSITVYNFLDSTPIFFQREIVIRTTFFSRINVFSRR